MEPTEPLYQRVPTRAEDGTLYSDFMVLIPRIRELPEVEMAQRVSGLQAVLGRYRQVVFADLNVRLNLLWVTVIPERGLIPDLISALRQRVPEVRLVGHE
tara:strand:- start:146 stop:445 length:300 start_codon:yes stop_codon:yes gene_type:complete